MHIKLNGDDVKYEISQLNLLNDMYITETFKSEFNRIILKVKEQENKYIEKYLSLKRLGLNSIIYSLNSYSSLEIKFNTLTNVYTFSERDYTVINKIIRELEEYDYIVDKIDSTEYSDFDMDNEYLLLKIYLKTDELNKIAEQKYKQELENITITQKEILESEKFVNYIVEDIDYKLRELKNNLKLNGDSIQTKIGLGLPDLFNYVHYNLSNRDYKFKLNKNILDYSKKILSEYNFTLEYNIDEIYNDYDMKSEVNFYIKVSW